MRLSKDSLEKILPKEKTDCEKCRELLFDFVSDITDGTQNEWLSRHLQGCPSCETEYNEIKDMLQVLAEDAEPQIPETFQDALHLKLVQAAEEMEAAKNRSFQEKFARWKQPAVWKEKFLGFGKETFRERLERFGRLGGWKVMAPAMVCLVLSVGVFSTGLYHQWMAADDILTADYETADAAPEILEPKSTKKPGASATVKPKAAASAKASGAPTATAKSTAKASSKATSKATSTAKATTKPSATAKATPKPTAAPVVENAPIAPHVEAADIEETPAVTQKPSEPAPRLSTDETGDQPPEAYRKETDSGDSFSGGEESMDAAASSAGAPGGGSGQGNNNANQVFPSVLLGDSLESALALQEKTYLIRVDDPEEYLNQYQQITGLDWKERKQETNPKDITIESRDDGIVLRLTDEEWEQFSDYTLEKGFLPYQINEDGNMKEVLIVITGYGD